MSAHWSLAAPAVADLDRLMAGGGPVHLVGIGGAGMSGIARLLLDRGVRVSGSDAKASPTTQALMERGATVWIGHRGMGVAQAVVVIVSSAVRPDNPDVTAARATAIPIVHRSAGLAALMTGDRVVAVTGTHGKTTTTSMITVAARAAGLDVSYAIGGDLVVDGVNARTGGAAVFVAEADESDGSFVAYLPDICVVGNVEPDHLDHYGTAAAVEQSFADLAARIPGGGLAVAGVDDAGAQRWAATVTRTRPDVRLVTVGRDPDCTVRVIDDQRSHRGHGDDADHAGVHLRLTRPGPGDSWDVRLAVPGRHNATNAALAWAACVEGLDLTPQRVLIGLASFTGARRRFDRRGSVGGVLVVDDYAHHPTEVRAAISAARDVVGSGRVHVLFQPHLYSRTRFFADQFAQALGTADTAVALDVYAAREDPEPGVDGSLVVRGLSTGRFVPDREEAVRTVVAAAAPGDIVMTVGAGDVTDLAHDILAGLTAAQDPATSHGMDPAGL